jgi:hypothetical protein|eukprot:4179017-Prymnesium_polylepis.3
MTDAEDFTVVPDDKFPTEADGEHVLQQLRSTINPETGQPFEAASSRANPRYIAAALAIQRSLFPKGNGEPNYTAAARSYVTGSPPSSGTEVKNWVDKLEKYQHAQRQNSLAVRSAII